MEPNQTDTLDYYNRNAETFVAGTISADMTDTQNRFLQLLPTDARILDFGCGAGRDTKAFLERGYQVEATDGSSELCKLASEFTGIPVKKSLFSELDSIEIYDGIWACSSILHLPKEELMDVFRKISTALKSDGILYTSFKYGTFEGERNGRYFTDFTLEEFQNYIKVIPSLTITDYWITSDVRPGRENEKWLNLLLRKN